MFIHPRFSATLLELAWREMLSSSAIGSCPPPPHRPLLVGVRGCPSSRRRCASLSMRFGAFGADERRDIVHPLLHRMSSGHSTQVRFGLATSKALVVVVGRGDARAAGRLLKVDDALARATVDEVERSCVERHEEAPSPPPTAPFSPSSRCGSPTPASRARGPRAA